MEYPSQRVTLRAFMDAYRKIIRAYQNRTGLRLTAADVAYLSADDAITAQAKAHAEAYCKRTYHRKQRNGKCACSMT